MNLLDKASIILTPTAYNNGEALCVKPSDGSGDFDFSRNSAATRVNAQGLVEDVQILSSNLVQELGQNWDFGGDWELVNETAEIQSSTQSYLRSDNLFPLTINIYKLQYEVVTTNGSNFRLAGGSSAFGTITLDSATIGIKTAYLTSNGTQRYLQFNQNAFRGSITNISVIEITDDTNLPRISYENFSYDGSGNIIPDSGCGSWLFEPQSTNLITYSETYGSGTFFTGTSGSTIDNTTSISPSGEANATQVTSTGAGKIQSIALTTLSQNTDYSFSFYAKNVDATAVKSRVLAIGGSGGSNLTEISYVSELSTENWSRITHNFNTGTNTTIYLFMSNALNSGGTIQLWGAQLEEDYATSYIPTSGTSVTRNQDVCNNGGSVASINSTEGVLYAEIAALSNENQTNRYITISSGSTSNRMILRYTNSGVSIYIIANGTGAVGGGFNFADRTQTIKAALRWANNDVALFVDGVKRFQANSFATYSPNTLTKLNMSSVNGGSFPFFGKTKALAVWKEALSDEELTLLTTI